MIVSIASLPVSLSYDEAVEAAYREDLDWIEEKLRSANWFTVKRHTHGPCAGEVHPPDTSKRKYFEAHFTC